MRRPVDLIGKKFGYLTVLEKAEPYVSPKGKRLSQWLCECECGNKLIVTSSNLTRLHTKSCGCHRWDGTHKMSDSRIYRIFNDMRTRCYLPAHHSYYLYGGRGIRICDEWLNNREAFLRWALDNGYAENLTLDRIDSNGDYSPENCRWVDRYVQANNTSRNVYLEYDGREQTIAQWCRERGFNRKLIGSRLAHGWTVEEAIETPPYAKRGRERAEEI